MKKINLIMKSTKNQVFNLIIFVLITNTNFSHSHDNHNGGCQDHCKRSFELKTTESKLKKIKDKIQIEYNYSCLSKSLCRG